MFLVANYLYNFPPYNVVICFNKIGVEPIATKNCIFGNVARKHLDHAGILFEVCLADN